MAEHLSLLVTAGNGPAECNQAVAHILKRMEQEATDAALSLSIHPTTGEHGPKSAVVLVYGAQRQLFQQRWCGTILWRMESQLRHHKKRSNWFVGVFVLEQTVCVQQRISAADVTFSTLRAGGPGGQHQNTTDSAVRATHSVSGLSVVVRDSRSQHRNKALALERLQNLADAQVVAGQAQRKSSQNQLHRQLQRGNPIRRFSGLRFVEET